jgi:hypothetical protein
MIINARWIITKEWRPAAVYLFLKGTDSLLIDAAI